MDAAHFATLYEQSYGRVFTYCWQRLRPDASAAEDMAASTFERAYRHRAKLGNGPAQVASYIFTIAHNLIMDHYRRRSIEWRALATFSGAQAAIAEGPERWVIEREEMAALMATIPEGARQALSLAAVGFSDRESAAALGVSRNVLRVTRHRARKLLNKRK